MLTAANTRGHDPRLTSPAKHQPVYVIAAWNPNKSQKNKQFSFRRSFPHMWGRGAERTEGGNKRVLWIVGN